MKKPGDQLSAWIDDQLNPSDRARFESDFDGGLAALESEKAHAFEIGSLLRQKSSPALSNPDFFNTSILDAIAPVPRTRRPAIARWLIPLLVPAAAAFAIAIVSYLQSDSHDASTEVFATTSDGPDVTAVAFHDPKSDITVIWMDGLASVSSNPPR